MNLEGARVIVVGLGISGASAAVLARARGATVVGTDRASTVQAASKLTELGIELALGGHQGVAFSQADLVIVSPGVPMFPELEAALRSGVSVVSEVEFSVLSLKHRPRELIAVGGTNGKSTVTSLLGALSTAAGNRTFTGGNLGTPLSASADLPWDVVILEVSSFQMERVSAFRPSVALLLNVTPDHLDRYDGMADYAAAKGNAFRNQQRSDWAVVPFADPVCEGQAARGKAATVSFGGQGHVRVEGDTIVDTRDNARYLLSECSLQGRHNAMNMAAAIAVAPRLHATPEVVRRVLSSFEGLPHRMTFVRTVAGVRYYDDSKGTNEGASVTALLGLAESKVVLIAGGKDKGGGYAALADALACKGRAVILLGEAAPLIEAALGQRIQSVHAKTMEEAVLLAHRHAQKGDAVLLSPACSSFDMYRDYKERGDVFVHAVRALVDGTSDSEATVPSGASAPSGRQA